MFQSIYLLSDTEISTYITESFNIKTFKSSSIVLDILSLMPFALLIIQPMSNTAETSSIYD